MLNLAREVELKLQQRSTTNELSPQGNDTKDFVDELNMTSVGINEISDEHAGPCKIVDVLADFSAHIDSNDNDLCEDLPTDLEETCDAMIKFDLCCVELIKHEEVFPMVLPNNSLRFIKLDAPIYLSHAMDKVSELTISKSFANTYGYTIQLIGEHDVNNKFLVHQICIACDNFLDLKENNILHMLNHFDMTSNIGDSCMTNSLLHDCTLTHNVPRHLGILNYYSPTLGWFNDENYKLNCDACCWNMTSNLLHYYEFYLCETLNVQHGSGVKNNDIYIYHAHTLSLLLDSFQHKRRRGHLSFQEKEDDMDMITMDMTIRTQTLGVFYNNYTQASN